MLILGATKTRLETEKLQECSFVLPTGCIS